MPENPEHPRWRGVNHLALVTTDMDATTRFYHGVLGANLVATIGTPGFRHYFFKIGDEKRSIYFTDPNGIALEASWWVTDATGRDADYGDRDLFGDLDPVPAVRELAEGGELGSTPVTTLTHDPTDIADPA